MLETLVVVAIAAYAAGKLVEVRFRFRNERIANAGRLVRTLGGRLVGKRDSSRDAELENLLKSTSPEVKSALVAILKKHST